jgi:hypothetical protein
MPIPAGFCLASVAVAFLLFAATAHAADYKMLLCAGNVGSNGYSTSTNTISAQHPSGIFDFENHCGPAPDPAGNGAFLRIAEHEASGSAGQTAYGAITISSVPWVAIIAAGGYTREPNAFNEGWRGQFWAEDYAGNGTEILNQGAGLPNSGLDWATTPVFAPHLWPYGYFGSYRGLVFELYCGRPAGCDRANYNAVDANTLTLILSDDGASQVGFTNTGSALMSGQWVRGAQSATWNSSDLGSGLRMERLRVDGSQRLEENYAGRCDLGASQASGEFARVFAPCPIGGPFGHSYALDTATLTDGAHTVSACSQDYGQYTGLYGTGGESCDQRTVYTDNTPPGAPSGLQVSSANAVRYTDHFGAQFSLPSNSGSPIAKVHYQVINAANEVVVPEQVLAATNPTEVPNIAGPKAPGDYRLRVWLEDGVGLAGPAATVPIPHDTTPPAAPQDVSVTPPTTSRSSDGFDLRWRDITDAGSPIDAIHYQVLDGSGALVVPTQTVNGDNPQSIANLDTPNDRGEYTLRLWLSDAEGNVGAPVSAPLTYDCVRSQVAGGTSLSAGFGPSGAGEEVVQEGNGSIISGSLRGAGGPTANAPLCVFSRIVTDPAREFEGVAITGRDGSYKFPVEAGPSRQLSVIYRPDNRELSAAATIQTVVHPTFKVHSKVVRNKHFAHFYGEIPGPDNNQVVVVLQAKVGKGKWLAFRRYRTRDGGHFRLRYRFHQTTRPTTYVMRAQVRSTVGYPYLQGNSRPLALRVLP